MGRKGGNPIHGGCRTRAYRIWTGMKSRCLNRNSKCYQNYGGRGITVSEEWKAFANFWRDMGNPPEKHTLERLDVNRGYCRENCRWVPKSRQGRNTRANRMIAYRGITLCLADWADRVRIPYMTLLKRLHAGKPFEEAVAMGYEAANDDERRVRAALAAVEGISTEQLQGMVPGALTRLYDAAVADPAAGAG